MMGIFMLVDRGSKSITNTCVSYTGSLKKKDYRVDTALGTTSMFVEGNSISFTITSN